MTRGSVNRASVPGEALTLVTVQCFDAEQCTDADLAPRDAPRGSVTRVTADNVPFWPLRLAVTPVHAPLVSAPSTYPLVSDRANVTSPMRWRSPVTWDLVQILGVPKTNWDSLRFRVPRPLTPFQLPISKNPLRKT
jgi:hypothetical protein